MASFSVRKSGWIQAKVRRKGYPEQSRTFATKRQAEKWAREVEAQMELEVFVSRADAERTTLYEALERYETEVSAHKKGYAQERYRIVAWRAHELAHRSLANLRSADFAKYRDKRLKAGASAATVRLDLAVISHLYTVASQEWSLPIANPIANIRKPRAQNARSRRLIKDEEERLIRAIEENGVALKDRANHWLKSIVLLAIETGMRQSELLHLQWLHLDLRARVAHLPDTKNGTARDVPLSSKAISILTDLRACAKRAATRGARVFPTTESALKQSWMRLVRRARAVYEGECKQADRSAEEIEADPLLTDLRFHDLRHEATSRLASKLAMHELMKVTGHKDGRMLARYYHPRAADLALKLG